MVQAHYLHFKQWLVVLLQIFKHSHPLAHGLNLLALPLFVSAFGVLAVVVVLVGLEFPALNMVVLLAVVVRGLV